MEGELLETEQKFLWEGALESPEISPLQVYAPPLRDAPGDGEGGGGSGSGVGGSSILAAAAPACCGRPAAALCRRRRCPQLQLLVVACFFVSLSLVFGHLTAMRNEVERQDDYFAAAGSFNCRKKRRKHPPGAKLSGALPVSRTLSAARKRPSAAWSAEAVPRSSKCVISTALWWGEPGALTVLYCETDAT